MRKLSGILAVGAFVLIGATASAAPVNTTATITVNLGALGNFSITGVGTVSIVGSGGNIAGGGVTDGTAIVVPAGLVTLATPITIDIDPNDTTLVTQIVLATGVGNGEGTFVANFAPGAQACPSDACVVGGNVGGVMPLVGVISPFVNLGAGGNPTSVNLANLNIGVGGTFMDTLLGFVPITGSGAPWTTGTGVVGTANGTASPMGSGEEPMTFVSPTFLSALGNAIPIVSTVTFDGISVMPAPEPQGALLLGAGMVGLLLVAALRRR